MSKTLFYRLFKAGEVPKKLLPMIEREGILFQEEGIGSVIHFRKFRAPGKYYGHKVNWGSGSIVLTKEHLLAFRYSTSTIGLAWSDVKTRGLACYVDQQARLCFAYDAANFNEKWSGNVEVKYSSAQPYKILRMIEEQINSTSRGQPA